MKTHNFEAWRRSKGWTQKQMGEQIGATQARVSKFERGHIPRLEPDQARKAVAVSVGVISLDDCLYDTPYTRARTATGALKKGPDGQRAGGGR